MVNEQFTLYVCLSLVTYHPCKEHIQQRTKKHKDDEENFILKILKFIFTFPILSTEERHGLVGSLL